MCLTPLRTLDTLDLWSFFRGHSGLRPVARSSKPRVEEGKRVVIFAQSNRNFTLAPVAPGKHTRTRGNSPGQADVTKHTTRLHLRVPTAFPLSPATGIESTNISWIAKAISTRARSNRSSRQSKERRQMLMCDVDDRVAIRYIHTFCPLDTLGWFCTDLCPLGGKRSSMCAEGRPEWPSPVLL